LTETTSSESKSFEATRVHQWWAGLRGDSERKRPGDPGALAELRRCSTALEVQMVPAFEALVRAMPNAHLESLAVAAAVVSHVREHDGGARVAEQLAQTGAGSVPAMSPLRFRRFLQVEGATERIAAGTRLVRQLQGRINVLDLASSLYWWDTQEDVQRRWARSYYSKLPREILTKSKE